MFLCFSYLTCNFLCLQGYSDNGIYVTEILSDSAASRAGAAPIFYLLYFSCCTCKAREVSNGNIGETVYMFVTFTRFNI
jgi:hypothetical protein